MQLVTELKDSLFNDDISDLCVDLTEIGIDSVMKDGVLSEIPIAKTIVSLSKTGIALRERNMLKQTLIFIKAVNSETISEENLKKYKSKLQNDNFAEKELGRVLYLLDRNIENIKSVILGKMYHSYVNGKISWEKFCELSEVNDRMFVSDYRMLLSHERMKSIKGNYSISRLIALGIMVDCDAPNASRTFVEWYVEGTKKENNIFPRQSFQMTSLGKELIQYLNFDFNCADGLHN